ncbi:MAG: hypothetical protein ACYCW6_12335 [Candidatus Xenobia bacterium]
MDLRSRAAGLRQQMQPQHQSQRTGEAPQENGIRLATMTRFDGTELRMSWAEYNGHRFLNVRVWTQDASSGTWWPDKTRGLSIRLRELADVAEGLEKALELAQQELDRIAAAAQTPRSSNAAAAPASRPSQPPAPRPTSRPECTTQGLDDLPPLRPAGR